MVFVCILQLATTSSISASMRDVSSLRWSATGSPTVREATTRHRDAAVSVAFTIDYLYSCDSISLKKINGSDVFLFGSPNVVSSQQQSTPHKHPCERHSAKRQDTLLLTFRCDDYSNRCCFAVSVGAVLSAMAPISF